ncbi:unnamed protein product [Meganyctiphanes norvegica]|uniref:RRM domain-containing protein n=1 Tax=Meganyctiphanes norvegica TaxID=48144 RepID=A0AAV2R9Y8_MEGNR
MAPFQDPKCKLFVGGLGRSTTEDSIKNYFESYGNITVKLAVNQETGQSKGFAFITFPQPDSVDQVQANRPHKIDGRDVGTTRVLPKDENGVADNTQVKKIFVARVKGPVEEDNLRQVFGEYGNVVSVTIPTDKESGRQKGFIFVEYDDTDSVDKVICYKDEIKIKGAPVDIKKAFEKGQEGGGRGGRGGRGGSRGGYGGDMGYQGGYDGYGDSGYGADDGYGAPRGRGRGAPRGGRGGGYAQKPSYESSGGYGEEMEYEGYEGGYDSTGYGAKASYGVTGGYETKADYGYESKGSYGGGGGYGSTGGYETSGGHWGASEDTYEGAGGYSSAPRGRGAPRGGPPRGRGGGDRGGRGGRGGGRGAPRGGAPRGRGGSDGGAMRAPRGRGARPTPYSSGGGGYGGGY